MILTFIEFRELVEKMRISEKKFFSNRTTENLKEAKMLEKQVDDAIASFKQPRETQSKLF